MARTEDRHTVSEPSTQGRDATLPDAVLFEVQPPKACESRALGQEQRTAVRDPVAAQVEVRQPGETGRAGQRLGPGVADPAPCEVEDAKALEPVRR